jgi:hypothetical protein
LSSNIYNEKSCISVNSTVTGVKQTRMNIQSQLSLVRFFVATFLFCRLFIEKKVLLMVPFF